MTGAKIYVYPPPARGQGGYYPSYPLPRPPVAPPLHWVNLSPFLWCYGTFKNYTGYVTGVIVKTAFCKSLVMYLCFAWNLNNPALIWHHYSIIERLRSNKSGWKTNKKVLPLKFSSSLASFRQFCPLSPGIKQSNSSFSHWPGQNPFARAKSQP